jgi:hypothetical protein
MPKFRPALEISNWVLDIFMAYYRLLKNAYKLTVRNPVLWIFGLFVVGSFNVNFLQFHDNVDINSWYSLTPVSIVDYFQVRPVLLALSSLALLGVTLAGLVITNWSRIMLVLLVKSLIETKQTELKKSIEQSRFLLWAVIKASLMTTIFMLVVAAALLTPPFFVKSLQHQVGLWVMGFLLFLPLAFTISCINIFTTFFIVLFRKNFVVALNLATDFFISKWTSVLGLTFVLVVIYCTGFAAGVVLIYLLKFILGSVLGAFPAIPSPVLSAIIMGVQVVGGLLLWILIAGLNVFFNTALLLLFFELITPIKTKKEKEEVKEMVPSPVAPI